MSSQRKVHGGYEEIETLEDPDGAVAVISQRINHNYFTAAFFRTFERDGQRERSAFFSTRHLASLKRLIGVTEKRLDELETGSANKRRG